MLVQLMYKALRARQGSRRVPVDAVLEATTAWSRRQVYGRGSLCGLRRFARDALYQQNLAAIQNHLTNAHWRAFS
jgi:hypothetical protein